MHPDPRFPHDMRAFTVTRRHVFTASFPLFARVFLLVLLCLALFSFALTVRDYGLDRVLEHFGYWLREFLVSIWPLFCLLAALCGFIYWSGGRQKVVGIPVRYGFDDSGIYIDDAYGSAFCAWELFISWREGREFILLNDGGRRVLWPKALWSEDELETQRGLMRETINPKRVHTS